MCGFSAAYLCITYFSDDSFSFTSFSCFAKVTALSSFSFSLGFLCAHPPPPPPVSSLYPTNDRDLRVEGKLRLIVPRSGLSPGTAPSPRWIPWNLFHGCPPPKLSLLGLPANLCPTDVLGYPSGIEPPMHVSVLHSPLLGPWFSRHYYYFQCRSHLGRSPAIDL